MQSRFLPETLFSTTKVWASHGELLEQITPYFFNFSISSWINVLSSMLNRRDLVAIGQQPGHKFLKRLTMPTFEIIDEQMYGKLFATKSGFDPWYSNITRCVDLENRCRVARRCTDFPSLRVLLYKIAVVYSG